MSSFYYLIPRIKQFFTENKILTGLLNQNEWGCYG